MIKAFLGVVIAGLALLANASVAGALDTAPSDGAVVATDSPVIITNYSFTASRMNYVQLYNNSDEVVSLDGWTLTYQVGSSSFTLGTLSGLMSPSKYIVVADSALLPDASFTYATTAPAPTDTTKVTAVHLIPSTTIYLSHDVTTPTISTSTVKEATTPPTYYLQRNISTSTGNYLSTFSFFVPSAEFQLYMDPLYEYPSETALQVSEILPNPRDCSPLETALDCSDYIKLYNPTDQPIDLSYFRLRNGYLGQAPSSSNTLNLEGVLEPGHYITIPMSVINTANWVWLEDSYGMKRYDSTVQDYPDASSTTKQGSAWAYDTADGTWKWTIDPTPEDAPSAFPVVLAAETSTPTTTLTPCRDDQYRSEETNRCRNIVTTTISSELTPCKEGQYRSEDTNRCRSVVSAISSLVPCDEDQERNPLTNRCRSTTTLASALTPCGPGQERNPDTNRCRQVTKSVAALAGAVQPVKDDGKSFVGWWALGGVASLALGYAVWEWRREIAGGFGKLGSILHARK